MKERADLQRQAAEWLVSLSVDDSDACDIAAREFAAWKARDPAHAEAAADMERLLAGIGGLQEGPARQVIDQELAAARRQRMGKRFGSALLLCLALALPAWVTWQRYPTAWLMADLDTASGQWRDEILADGSRISLGSASAVNLHFDGKQRQIELLRGEIRLDVAPDPQRPLTVVTAQGSIRALGTRLLVAEQHDATQLTMLESKTLAKAARGGDGVVVEAGQQTTILNNAVGPLSAIDSQTTDRAWNEHKLIARGLPLPEVLDRLQRQTPGLLSYDRTRLASITVYAVIPLDDPQKALQLLENSLPITVSRFTPWLVRIQTK